MRPWATVATVAALGFVAALTLLPRRFVAPIHGLFLSWTDAHAQHLLAWFPQADSEQVLNAILFAPLGAALAVLFGRRLWPAAVLACATLSAAVEYAQSDIPGRVSDPHDIAWNTLGAAVGTAIVAVGYLLAAIARRVAAATRRAG
ncbi:MAG: VanZ family protein [Microbacterium sp.]|nr:VanZ family protein [Microbacterium sp.]